MDSALSRHRRYAAGDFYLVDVLENRLKTIEARASLNAFIQVYAAEAQERAAAIDAKRAGGKSLGPLAGLIVALKDNICLGGQRTTCGSRILENFVSPYDATVVRKILAADGLIIGKTNLDEFAMGSSSENSHFGAVRHPLDESRVAGGSSGGSAVAVAAGIADLALGSDTGGSIRQPAAFCGIAGLKPTYGRVSRYGLVAYASSLDQIGPFAATVADAAWMLGVIAGRDPNDSTSLDEAVPDYQQAFPGDVQGLKIALPRQCLREGLDEEVKANLHAAIAYLREGGARVEEIDLPLNDYAIAAYYIIATAEASSNLARYDGVRYGYRAPEAGDLEAMYTRSRSAGFGREAKRRIMLGTHVLSSGYYDAYYKKGQQVRRLIKEQYDRALANYDLLLTPTTPTPAFKLGEKIDDPLQMYLSDIFTVTVNLAGICALSVPTGHSASGLPIGMQLIGGALQEETLFRAGDFLEKMRGD